MKKQNKKEAWAYKIFHADSEFAAKEILERVLTDQQGELYAWFNKELLKSRKELKAGKGKELKSLKELRNEEAWDNIKKIKQILLRVRNGEFITPAIGEILELLSQERKKVVNQIIDEMANHSDWYCPKCYYEIKELLMKFLRD